MAVARLLAAQIAPERHECGGVQHRQAALCYL